MPLPLINFRRFTSFCLTNALLTLVLFQSKTQAVELFCKGIYSPSNAASNNSNGLYKAVDNPLDTNKSYQKISHSKKTTSHIVQFTLSRASIYKKGLSVVLSDTAAEAEILRKKMELESNESVIVLSLSSLDRNYVFSENIDLKSVFLSALDAKQNGPNKQIIIVGTINQHSMFINKISELIKGKNIFSPKELNSLIKYLVNLPDSISAFNPIDVLYFVNQITKTFVISTKDNHTNDFAQTLILILTQTAESNGLSISSFAHIDNSKNASEIKSSITKNKPTEAVIKKSAITAEADNSAEENQAIQSLTDLENPIILEKHRLAKSTAKKLPEQAINILNKLKELLHSNEFKYIGDSHLFHDVTVKKWFYNLVNIRPEGTDNPWTDLFSYYELYLFSKFSQIDISNGVLNKIDEIVTGRNKTLSNPKIARTAPSVNLVAPTNPANPINLVKPISPVNPSVVKLNINPQSHHLPITEQVLADLHKQESKELLGNTPKMTVDEYYKRFPEKLTEAVKADLAKMEQIKSEISKSKILVEEIKSLLKELNKKSDLGKFPFWRLRDFEKYFSQAESTLQNFDTNIENFIFTQNRHDLNVKLRHINVLYAQFSTLKYFIDLAITNERKFDFDKFLITYENLSKNKFSNW